MDEKVLKYENCRILGSFIIMEMVIKNNIILESFSEAENQGYFVYLYRIFFVSNRDKQ